MQGFNMGRYVPPELEGITSGNRLAGKHALGHRARKAGQGILTVRFEMPYAIWCTTCPKPTIIGQGVRFNAEKKKVGNYYTTPIYSFRMKHTPCGGWIEIRTDPKNTAYVVIEGAKKRDTGDDKIHEGDIQIMTDEERQRLQSDAFAALEAKVDDKKQAIADRSRIGGLLQAKEKDWEDPYAASKRLRRAFRVDRKAREKNNGLTEALKDRMSLALDILAETDEDRARAAVVDFGPLEGTSTEAAISKTQSRGLFAVAVEPAKQRERVKHLKQAQMARNQLQKKLSQNTRAAVDPFLVTNPPLTSPPSPSPIMALKRKRISSHMAAEIVASATAGSMEMTAPGRLLVDYDSD